jgi:hypothetical protein
MRFRRFSLAALLAAGALAVGLSGCSDGMKKQLGLGKNPPDEFKVAERAPLSIPPKFKLRPPQPGAGRPQEESPREKAEVAVFTREGARGDGAQAFADTPSLSPGERRLLAKAGAGEVPEDIRQLVSREAERRVEANRTLVDKLIFWREPQPVGTVVDPTEEARRIRENQALGEELTKGETPTIERRERGLLEGLFEF